MNRFSWAKFYVTAHVVALVAQSIFALKGGPARIFNLFGSKMTVSNVRAVLPMRITPQGASLAKDLLGPDPRWIPFFIGYGVKVGPKSWSSPSVNCENLWNTLRQGKENPDGSLVIVDTPIEALPCPH